MTEIEVRRRRPEDLASLATLLGEQQPTSSYPIRWPLPFPVEDFLVRDGEYAAWVAEWGGRVAGHVSVLAPGDDVIGRAFRTATGREDLAVVSVLFTGLETRGRGLGRILLDEAVSWSHEHGLLPVLDVIPVHGRAMAIYRRAGWREVGVAPRLDWMSDDVPDMRLMVAPPGPGQRTGEG